MQISLIWAIVIAVVTFGAGYVFRMLDSRVTTALKEGLEKSPVVEGQILDLGPNEHGVLRVTVDQALKWHLELDGVQLEADRLTPEQRARLVNVIVQIRPWIDGKTAPVLATPAPAAAPIVPVANPMVPPAQPVSAAVVPQAAAPAAAPRLDIARGFRTLLENDIKKPEVVRPPSIVSMIDDVLQKKLESSPLAMRRVRLEEGPSGEVVVFVGSEKFNGVDAVPYDEVKGIIREAITEWDRKH